MSGTKIKSELDLVWGADEMAKLIGKSRRATYGMLEAGKLPARRVGNRWCISRKVLTEFFETAGQ